LIGSFNLALPFIVNTVNTAKQKHSVKKFEEIHQQLNQQRDLMEGIVNEVVATDSTVTDEY